MRRARDFLSLDDVTIAELHGLLRDAAKYKRHRQRHGQRLAGRVVALIFQKPSVRTRVAFEVAVRRLGGSTIYLGDDDIRLGEREPVGDAARVLARYVDAVVLRTFAHRTVQEFASHADVPVINGLSDLSHPCQALADVFTIQEHFGRLKGLALAYIGDGNNVLHALMQACAMLGIHLSAATPASYRPEAKCWAATSRLAAAQGARLRWVSDPRQAARGADVLYTDVWVSMGNETERKARRRAFRGYQVNTQLLKLAARGCRVMHCLPAHRGEEITDEVLDGPQSLVLEQAENRLHVQKALLAMLLNGKATR